MTFLSLLHADSYVNIDWESSDSSLPLQRAGMMKVISIPIHGQQHQQQDEVLAL